MIFFLQSKHYFFYGSSRRRLQIIVHQLGGLYGSLEGNKQNMYNLNLRVKSIKKMHDSKDRTVAVTF